MPYLISSKTLLMGGVIDSVHHASAKWEKHAFLSADKQHTQVFLERTFRLLSRVELVLITLFSYAHQAQVTAFLTHADPTDLLHCCNQAIKLVYLLYTQAEVYTSDTFTPAAVEALVPAFSEVGRMIWDHLPMDASVVEPISYPAYAALEHNTDEEHLLSYEFSHVAPEMVSRQHCNAPGCTRTFADADRRFRYCAGCLRVCYCSRACQKAAWGHEIGHRDACSAIRAAFVHRRKRREAKTLQEMPLWTPEIAQAYRVALAHRHRLVSLEMSSSRYPSEEEWKHQVQKQHASDSLDGTPAFDLMVEFPGRF